MSPLRLAVIAFSLTLLVACGGGGGGGGSVAASPNSPLPNPLIADVSEARRHINDRKHPGFMGNPAVPTDPLTSVDIQRRFLSRAMAANTLAASDVYLAINGLQGVDASTTCTNGSCGTVPIGNNAFTISLENIGRDIGSRFELTRISSEYTPVMLHVRIPENPSKEPVTLAQHRAAGRDGDDVFEYLSYGGWITESAFSVDMLTIKDGSSESFLLVGLAYGNASGSRPEKRPTGSNNNAWRGSVVGIVKSSGDTVQGDLDLLFFNLTGSDDIDEIKFRNLVNLNTGEDIANMAWENIFVNDDGTFSSTTGGNIEGRFYGMINSEVGGTFNRDGIIGAFGGVRQ